MTRDGTFGNVPGHALQRGNAINGTPVPLTRKERSVRPTISKYLALGATASAFALLAGACGSGSTSSGGGASSDQVHQMYTWVSTDNDRAQWQSFVDAAKEKDPNFTLTFDGPAFNDYWTKVKTRMVASDAPCILTTQAARAQELSGLLEPLDSYMEAAGIKASDYNAAMMQGMTVDGKVLALPYDAEPDVLYYNREMFEKAGLEAPSTSYTTEQFLKDAKALTGDGKYGIAVKPLLLGNAPGDFGIAFGGQVSADGKNTLTDPKFVEGVQFAFDLVHKEQVAVAPNAADNDGPAQTAFTSGTAAMIVDGPWMYGSFEKELGDKLGVAVIPTPTGQPRAVIQGSGFGIAKSCPDKQAAFNVLKELVTPEVIGTVADKQGTVPSVESAMDKWAANKPGDSAEAVRVLLENGTPLVTTSTWNQINTSFQQYSPEGFRGTKTAQDILTDLQNSAG